PVQTCAAGSSLREVARRAPPREVGWAELADQGGPDAGTRRVRTGAGECFRRLTDRGLRYSDPRSVPPALAGPSSRRALRGSRGVHLASGPGARTRVPARGGGTAGAELLPCVVPRTC